VEVDLHTLRTFYTNISYLTYFLSLTGVLTQKETFKGAQNFHSDTQLFGCDSSLRAPNS